MRENTDVSDAVISEFRSRFGCTRPFAAMLVRRGLMDDASIEAFLHPESQSLCDPFVFSDMDRAVQRIRSAIDAGERICIFGDYDTDGVCATAILTDALKKLGANVSYLLPSRQGDGYGLSMGAIDRMHENGVQLIVTVDNGISAHAEIAYAKTLGMDTVVTDHHRCHETLPDAEAVVCATRVDQDAELSSLCGAVVAMMLAAALGASVGGYLPIAALATMADVVPLERINRAIVKKGLPLVGMHPGLKALLDAAGVQTVTGESVLSFILAPRINAAGRMGDATRAVEVLLTEDEAERQTLAAALESENVKRRAEEQRILTEAEAKIDDPAPRILVLSGEDWNTGVIGIVASRLLERYRCPVLLFSRVGDALVGSGRSVPAVDLFQLLSRHRDLFLRFGGHKLAAGATVAPERFSALCEALKADLQEQFPLGLPEQTHTVEDRLSASEITVAFARELSLLAPFGEGNRAPLFLIEGQLSGVRTMGKDGAHIGAKLSDGGAEVRIVSFGNGDRYADWCATSDACAYASIELSSYLGRPEVSVRAEALTRRTDERVTEAAMRCIRSILYGLPLPDRDVLDRLRKVSEAEVRTVYRTLLNRLKKGAAVECLSETELCALLPLYEIGVVRYQNEKFFAETVQEKKQIQNALLYRAVCLE